MDRADCRANPPETPVIGINRPRLRYNRGHLHSQRGTNATPTRRTNGGSHETPRETNAKAHDQAHSSTNLRPSFVPVQAYGKPAAGLMTDRLHDEPPQAT
jgi:hypothetical protein